MRRVAVARWVVAVLVLVVARGRDDLAALRGAVFAERPESAESASARTFDRDAATATEDRRAPVTARGPAFLVGLTSLRDPRNTTDLALKGCRCEILPTLPPLERLTAEVRAMRSVPTVRLAFVLLLHDNLPSVTALLAALAHPSDVLVVHIDRGASDAFRSAALDAVARRASTVHFTSGDVLPSPTNPSAQWPPPQTHARQMYGPQYGAETRARAQASAAAPSLFRAALVFDKGDSFRSERFSVALASVTPVALRVLLSRARKDENQWGFDFLINLSDTHRPTHARADFVRFLAAVQARTPAPTRTTGSGFGSGSGSGSVSPQDPFRRGGSFGGSSYGTQPNLRPSFVECLNRPARLDHAFASLAVDSLRPEDQRLGEWRPRGGPRLSASRIALPLKQSLPEDLNLCDGSQWAVLGRELTEWIADAPRAARVERALLQSFVPDEVSRFAPFLSLPATPPSLFRD